MNSAAIHLRRATARSQQTYRPFEGCLTELQTTWTRTAPPRALNVTDNRVHVTTDSNSMDPAHALCNHVHHCRVINAEGGMFQVTTKYSVSTSHISQ